MHFAKFSHEFNMNCSTELEIVYIEQHMHFVDWNLMFQIQSTYYYSSKLILEILIDIRCQLLDPWLKKCYVDIEGILTILIVHLTFQRSYKSIASRDIYPCSISKIYFYIDLYIPYISNEQPNVILLTASFMSPG